MATAVASSTTVVAEPILRTDGVGKTFGGVWAVDQVSVEVAKAEIIGIIGPNGAGKTTLFNLIAGAFRPTRGRIFLRDRDITRQPPHARAREGIARTFQLMKPFVSLPIDENVRLCALASGAKAHEAAQRTATVLEYMGLAPLRAKPGSELNAVEAKRLEVARALATAPAVLLLDEIFSGSSSEEADELADAVKQLRADGLTILVVEHNMRAVRAVADRVIAMNVGRVISEGTAKHVFNDPRVVESYLGESD